MSARSALRCRVPACRAVLGWVASGRFEAAPGTGLFVIAVPGDRIAIHAFCGTCRAVREVRGLREVTVREPTEPDRVGTAPERPAPGW